MKKILLVIAFFLVVFVSPSVNAEEQTSSTGMQDDFVRNQITSRANSITVYRLYHAASGAHYFTTKSVERQSMIEWGWRDEGIAWHTIAYGPSVYQKYNPNTHERLYTLNLLEAPNWHNEGTVFFAGINNTNETPRAVHRLFNPNTTGAGSHHYTINWSEVQMLVSKGWRHEGAVFWVK